MENNHYLVTLPTSLISTIIELSITDEDDSDNMRENRKSALKGELKKLYQINPHIQKFNRTEELLKD